jgi:hypothetical protein
VIRALLALPLAGAIAAPPQFRASVDVVRIEALVLHKGRPVAGLGAGDFTVTDNGAVQTITVRALARQPIDVAAVPECPDHRHHRRKRQHSL